ncbi:MAG: HEPN family nuclease [Firmicutes bacterium]|nr:HEPN family nuclease [Bacillota bacterium]
MSDNCIGSEFIMRTLHILTNYEGPYGVTLLVNCLLGLIVLPKEKDIHHISHRDHIHFFDLGIEESDISWGNIDESERTAARFLRCLRNSVAHLQLESISEDGEIQSLRFSDHMGFEVVFRIDSLKEMLKKLAKHLQKDS